MGDNTIPTRSDANVITADWFNVFRNALLIDFLPRNASGVVEASAGRLGNLDYPWREGHFGSVTVDGVLLDTNALLSRSHRIVSGAAKTSGYPEFLEAAGSGNGLSADILASTTDLELSVDGEDVTIESDQTFPALTAAPGSQNTCAINDASLAGASSTKILGEYDRSYITIGTIGTGITALNGTIAAFLKGSEVFLALIDTGNSRLYPIYRGWAGTSRETLSHTNTITLLKLSTLLMKSDGLTKVSSTYYPESVTVAPIAGTAGKVYIERSTGRHAYDDGATINYDYIILGWAVCDSADCEWVQPYDFDLAWDSDADVDFYIHNTTTLKIKAGSRGAVAGAEVGFPQDISVTTSDLDAGEALTVDTDYFVYMKNTGAVVLSTVPPRPPHFLIRGAYHPLNYYRAIGMVHTNGSSQFEKIYLSHVSEDKITTTADGIHVDGTVEADGVLTDAGSVSAPAHAFTTDTDSGMYRIGANNVGVAAGGVKALDLSATAASVPGTIETASGGAFKAKVYTGTIAASATADITAPGAVVGVCGIASLSNSDGWAPIMTAEAGLAESASSTIYYVLDSSGGNTVTHLKNYDNNSTISYRIIVFHQ
jgi:hypothetical protein